MKSRYSTENPFFTVHEMCFFMRCEERVLRWIERFRFCGMDSSFNGEPFLHLCCGIKWHFISMKWVFRWIETPFHNGASNGVPHVHICIPCMYSYMYSYMYIGIPCECIPTWGYIRYPMHHTWDTYVYPMYHVGVYLYTCIVTYMYCVSGGCIHV